MTILCVITGVFAVFHHFSHKALQNFASLRIDVTTDLSVLLCCEVTSLKWTQWEGEMVGNLVLSLNGRSFNKCTQKKNAAYLLFYGQVEFSDIRSDSEAKVSVVGECNI